MLINLVLIVGEITTFKVRKVCRVRKILYSQILVALPGVSK